jgi:hypothetical protein
VTVQWQDFHPINAELLVRPSHEAGNAAAAELHKARLAATAQRRPLFLQVLARNGIPPGAEGDRPCADIDAWLQSEAQRPEAPADAETELWRSVAHDAAMLFGEELMVGWPSLHWRLKQGSPRNVFYNCTVLMGFSRARNAQFDLELPFSYMSALALLATNERKPRPFYLNVRETAQQYG